LETVDSIYNQYKTLFLIFERLSTFIFLVEYILRVWVSIEAKKNNDNNLITRLKYMITWPAIIDLLAVLSGLLPMLFEVDLRLLRALRMIRLLKFSRYFKVMNLLLGVLKEEKQSFLAAMFLLVIALLIASTGIYIFEKEAQPDKFGSIPESMWWAIATLTTIGYGDVTPITSMGKLFGAIIAIIGIGTVALPSGILASGFSDQLKRRQSKYENELNKALQDGIITTKERSKLTQIAEDMNLSEDQIKTMEKKLKEIN
jgi:voltage-gated potassium channel